MRYSDGIIDFEGFYHIDRLCIGLIMLKEPLNESLKRTCMPRMKGRGSFLFLLLLAPVWSLTVRRICA